MPSRTLSNRILQSPPGRGDVDSVTSNTAPTDKRGSRRKSLSTAPFGRIFATDRKVSAYPAGTSAEEMLTEAELQFMYGEKITDPRWAAHFDTITPQGSCLTMLLRGMSAYEQYAGHEMSMAQLEAFASLPGSRQDNYITRQSNGKPYSPVKVRGRLRREIQSALDKFRARKANLDATLVRLSAEKHIVMANLRLVCRINDRNQSQYLIRTVSKILDKMIQVGSTEIGLSSRQLSQLTGMSRRMFTEENLYILREHGIMDITIGDPGEDVTDTRYRILSSAFRMMDPAEYGISEEEYAEFSDLEAVEPLSYDAANHPVFQNHHGQGWSLNGTSGILWSAIRLNPSLLRTADLVRLYDIGQGTVDLHMRNMMELGILVKNDDRTFSVPSHVELDRLAVEHGLSDKKTLLSEMYARDREIRQMYRKTRSFAAQLRSVQVIVEGVNLRMARNGDPLRLVSKVVADQEGIAVFILDQNTGKIVYDSRQYQEHTGKWDSRETGQVTLMELAALAGFRSMSHLFSSSKKWFGDRYMKVRSLLHDHVMRAKHDHELSQSQADYIVRAHSDEVDREFNSLVRELTREDHHGDLMSELDHAADLASARAARAYEVITA